MTKSELKNLIKADKKNYSCGNFITDVYYSLSKNQIKYYMKNVILARKVRFYRESGGFVAAIKRIYYERKYNILAQKSNINIRGKFGKCLKISHENIVVNKFAELGDNVRLHGSNCIGNGNNGKKESPKIGNNVDIGFGATLIGDITIADGIVIGANSLVNKSFLEEGIVIAGVPARKIRDRKKDV